MRTQFAIPVLATILILGVFSSSQDVFASKKLFVGGLSWDTDSQSFVVTGEVNHGMVKAVEKAGFTLQIAINISGTQISEIDTPIFDRDGVFVQSIPWNRILDDGSEFDGPVDVTAKLQILNPAGKGVGKVESLTVNLDITSLGKTVNLFFHDEDNNPIADIQCVIYAPYSEESINGVTDSNGILTGSFTPEVEHVGVYCLYEDVSSIICSTNLTGFNTDIDLELGQYYCPTGI